jgi:hypothetical protein
MQYSKLEQVTYNPQSKEEQKS